MAPSPGRSPDVTYSVEARAKAEELAAVHRELGAVRAQLAQARSETWFQTSHLGVTERRETVAATVAEFTAETEKLTAEVEALKVELALALDISASPTQVT